MTCPNRHRRGVGITDEREGEERKGEGREREERGERERERGERGRRGEGEITDERGASVR